MEVHKFSKFIHGCAVLLPEEVCYQLLFVVNLLSFNIFYLPNYRYSFFKHIQNIINYPPFDECYHRFLCC